eukprot:2639793-Pleurochrysis_carterae.AAC.1
MSTTTGATASTRAPTRDVDDGRRHPTPPAMASATAGAIGADDSMLGEGTGGGVGYSVGGEV